MRVVSLVPSWTETLLEAGVTVVGRTRFCIHPEKTSLIPVVGGTKDLDFTLLDSLQPDLLLLDQEENLPWMAEDRGYRIHCSHINSVNALPSELKNLASIIGNARLLDQAKAWENLLESPVYPKEMRAEKIPGIIDWIRHPKKEPENILYIIWRGPWMSVSRQTFIGSMLSHLGYGNRLPNFSEKYPKVDLAEFDPENTLLLFSSEPYPFVKKRRELEGLGFPSALVDGEAYSWFGVRSQRFLEETLRL